MKKVLFFCALSLAVQLYAQDVIVDSVNSTATTSNQLEVENLLKMRFSYVQYHEDHGGWYLLSFQRDGQATTAWEITKEM